MISSFALSKHIRRNQSILEKKVRNCIRWNWVLSLSSLHQNMSKLILFDEIFHKAQNRTPAIKYFKASMSRNLKVTSSGENSNAVRKTMITNSRWRRGSGAGWIRGDERDWLDWGPGWKWRWGHDNGFVGHGLKKTKLYKQSTHIFVGQK